MRNKNGKPVAKNSLGPIPPGWTWQTLGEISEIVSGVTKGQKHRDSSSLVEVPYLRVANVQRGYFDLSEIKTIFTTKEKAEKLRLQLGDVLFNEGGDKDKLGRGWVWNGEVDECIHQNHVFRARLNDGMVPKFISYYSNSLGQDWFLQNGKHTTNLASINQSVLRRFPVPTPPLVEQKRIVAKIEELFSDLDAGVAALERARANLRRYRPSVLKSAVEGRLTAEWRAANSDVEPAHELLDRILHQRRQHWEQQQLATYKSKGKQPPKDWRTKYKPPAPPDTTNLPELPTNWCWASVEQLGNVQLGRQRSPKNRSKEYPTKYLRAANITNAGLDVTDVLDMEFTPVERERYVMKKGDIVVSEASGSPEHVGKPAVWNDEIPNCCFQNTVIRIRPEQVRSDYLLAVFRNCYENKVFAKLAGGVGINHLSAAKFSVLAIPIAPLPEQAEIAGEIDRQLLIINNMNSVFERNFLRADRLRQSVLKRAFEGRLVVGNQASAEPPVMEHRRNGVEHACRGEEKWNKH